MKKHRANTMRTANQHRGFTLLEMLVALGLFTVVAVIAVGALVRIVSLNRQAQTLQSSMNNLSFALEAMSRELRVGSNFHCENNPDWSYDANTDLQSAQCQAGAGALIAFKSARTAEAIDGSGPCRLVFMYRFRPEGSAFRLEKAEQSQCEASLGPTSFVSVLDDANLTMNRYSLGVYRGAGGYSWAFIRMSGFAGKRDRERNPFDVETSVSARIAD